MSRSSASSRSCHTGHIIIISMIMNYHHYSHYFSSNEICSNAISVRGFACRVFSVRAQLSSTDIAMKTRRRTPRTVRAPLRRPYQQALCGTSTREALGDTSELSLPVLISSSIYYYTLLIFPSRRRILAVLPQGVYDQY